MKVCEYTYCQGECETAVAEVPDLPAEYRMRWRDTEPFMGTGPGRNDSPKTSKPRLGLLGGVTFALAQVADVLEFGLSKYPDVDNWRQVPRDKHIDALMRHVMSYAEGIKTDPESGKHHLAHAACRALFLVCLDDQ